MFCIQLFFAARFVIFVYACRNFHRDKENYQTDCKEYGKGKKADVKAVAGVQRVEEAQKTGQAQAKDSGAFAFIVVAIRRYSRLLCTQNHPKMCSLAVLKQI